jgi:D-alanyl-D-alanine carboxypeptidase/D-alanyl-D-alanine-endopeptidase (penicillin-binding protein 4)
VRIPAAPSAVPVAAAASQGTLQSAPLRKVIAQGLTKALGRHVLVAVAGTSGAIVTDHGRGTATPASTNKLLTAATVLALDGPEKRFTTRTVLSAGAGGSTVTLVGGGDPLLASRPAASGDYPQVADLTTLAKETAAALRSAGRTTVTLRYDTSLFAGPTVDPSWPHSYIAEAVVSPITALWADEGRTDDGIGRVTDPARSAATTFAHALAVAGVKVRGPITEQTAPKDAADLAHVESPPLREIVDHVLEVSDNEGAEVLAHQAGIASGAGGSFAGGVKAVEATLGRLGVDATGLRLHDGSGLSRSDRIAPATLVGVLQHATTEPRLAPIVSALPVAGFSGSLDDRFEEHTDPGRGIVRAKTGTLTGVDALAGYTQDATGTPVVFAIMADHVAVPNTLDAREALDALATALSTCRCG